MLPLRDENPTRTFPIFTILIILLNAVVYYFELRALDFEGFIYDYGLIPASFIKDIKHYRVLEAFSDLLSSMFMHGNLFHIISNMWFFWIFGNNVEDALGHFRFLLFYLLCGTGAALLQVIMGPSSEIPMVGASGAISGVLGAYFLFFPGARILTLVIYFFFVRLIYIPAGIFLLFWFIMQVLNSLVSNPQTGGVAWYAHIGGFVTGLLLSMVLGKRKRRSRYI